MLLSCHSFFNYKRAIIIFSYMCSQDVVYSDIKVKPSRDASSLTNYKLRESVYVDDVTYSEVIVSRQPKSDTECVYV